MRGLIPGVCALFLPLAAAAGTLTALGPLPYDDSRPQPRPGCTHRFDGIVETGDLAQYQAIPTDPQAVICLDSPGGALLEGIAIAEHLRDVGIGTRLEDGATCESACSVIFMSGTYFAEGEDLEDWERGRQPWRSLHPTARLGFHAPRLTVEAGQYNEETVTLAYDIALKTLSEFSRRLIQTGPDDGYNAVMFDPDLFSEMIGTPHDTMFHIDTVDKAGRYQIPVGPVPAPTAPDRTQLIHGCANFWAWTEDRSVSYYAERIPGATVSGTLVKLDNTGLDCDFVQGGQDSAWRIWDIDVPDIAFHPGNTPLSALAP